MTSPGLYLRVCLAWAAVTLSVCLPRALTAQEPPAAAASESQPARLAPVSLLLDVAFAGNFGVAVGERGHVLVTEDAGKSWEQRKVPTQALLTAVALVSKNHLWAVGHDAVILFSSDSGQTWTLQHRAPEWEQPLFDVFFLNPNRGFALGAYGLLLETNDAGASWTPHDVDDEGPHLYGLTQAPNGDLYLAGEFGALFASRDTGTTWERLPSPYGGTFFGALATADEVYVFGLRGNLYRSTDGGFSWHQIDTATHAGLQGGAALPDGRAVFSGQAGTVVWVSPGASSAQLSVREDRLSLSALALSPRGLVAAGEHGIHAINDVSSSGGTP